MELLEKLEEVKQLGAYSLVLNFGEGEGADDSDIPTMERNIRLICSPVGYLGGMKVMYKGTVKSFLNFDLKSKPTLISNPPEKHEYEKDGFYYWRSDRSIEMSNENGKVFH